MVFKRFAFVTFKKRVLKVQNETSKNEIVNEAFTKNVNKSFVKLIEKRFIELKKTFNILSQLTFPKKLRTKENYVSKGFNFAKKILKSKSSNKSTM